MKDITLLVVLLLSMQSTNAQTKFIGTWYEDKKFDDSLTNDCLLIRKKSTVFFVCPQLDLICRNKYKGDTLLLYVVRRDCGSMFQPRTKYQPPKINSLFAKCYIREKMLHIIYTQKLFRDNIEYLQLNTVLRK